MVEKQETREEHRHLEEDAVKSTSEILNEKHGEHESGSDREERGSSHSDKASDSHSEKDIPDKTEQDASNARQDVFLSKRDKSASEQDESNSPGKPEQGESNSNGIKNGSTTQSNAESRQEEENKSDRYIASSTSDDEPQPVMDSELQDLTSTFANSANSSGDSDKHKTTHPAADKKFHGENITTSISSASASGENNAHSSVKVDTSKNKGEKKDPTFNTHKDKNAPSSAEKLSREEFPSIYPEREFYHSEAFRKTIQAQSKRKQKRFHHKYKTSYRFIKDDLATETIVCINGLLTGKDLWNDFVVHMLNNARNQSTETKDDFSEDVINDTDVTVMLNGQEVEEYDSSSSDTGSDQKEPSPSPPPGCITRVDSYYSKDEQPPLSPNKRHSKKHEKRPNSFPHYNYLLYDHFNSGKSSQVPQPTPQVFVRQLSELLRHLKLIPSESRSSSPKRNNLVLVSHSLGTIIGLHFTNQFPLCVSRLVMCSPVGMYYRRHKVTSTFIRCAKKPVVREMLFHAWKKFKFSYHRFSERAMFAENKELKERYTNLIKNGMTVDEILHTIKSTILYFPYEKNEYLIEWLHDYQKDIPEEDRIEVLICAGCLDKDTPTKKIFPHLEEKLRYTNATFALFKDTRHAFIFERNRDFFKVVRNFLTGGSTVTLQNTKKSLRLSSKVLQPSEQKMQDALEEKYQSYMI